MAFEVTVSGGTIITVVPSDSGDCTLSIDDVEYPIGESAKAGGLISSIAEVEAPEHERILRTCIDCQGRRYCITNGCANTPCGWICD